MTPFFLCRTTRRPRSRHGRGLAQGAGTWTKKHTWLNWPSKRLFKDFKSAADKADIGHIKSEQAVALGINLNTAGATSASSTTRSAATSDARAVSKATTETQALPSGVSLSATSRQLAQSAERADKRDASMSRTELADEATRLREQFSGAKYNAANAAREVPDTDDPTLLARAKQATEFTQSHGQSGTNPFASLSDDQLTLVMYDDSGSYTTNERRAAWLEQYDRRQAWKQQVIAQAHIEYKTTGQNDKFYQTCIDYYDALPPIEQAQYPADYVSRTQNWIENNQPFEGRNLQFNVTDPANL